MTEHIYSHISVIHKQHPVTSGVTKSVQLFTKNHHTLHFYVNSAFTWAQILAALYPPLLPAAVMDDGADPGGP